MKLMQNINTGLCLAFSLWVLVACNSTKHEFPPKNLPQAPNCAADGPGCKQFNPDKPSGDKKSY